MITHKEAENIIERLNDGYNMILDIEGKEVLNVALTPRKGRLCVTITAICRSETSTSFLSPGTLRVFLYIGRIVKWHYKVISGIKYFDAY